MSNHDRLALHLIKAAHGAATHGAGHHGWGRIVALDLPLQIVRICTVSHPCELAIFKVCRCLLLILKRQLFNIALSLLFELLIVLILTLDLLVKQSRLVRGQIVHAFDLLRSRIVDVVLDQIARRHRVNPQRLVPVERVVAQRQQVEQLASVVRPQVQILRYVKEQHEVVLILGAENDRAHIFYRVVAGLLVAIIASLLERIDTLGRLNVDSLLLLIGAPRANRSKLLGALGIHDDLARGLKLRLNFWCHNLRLRLYHASLLSNYILSNYYIYLIFNHLNLTIWVVGV